MTDSRRVRGLRASPDPIAAGPHRHLRLALRAVARRLLSGGIAATRRARVRRRARFSTIEINGSFYSLQRPEYYQRWHDETPPGFVFAVKGPRYRHAHDEAARRRGGDWRTSSHRASRTCATSSVRSCGSCRRRFAFDAERLEAFFALLPRDSDQASRLARRHNDKVRGRARLAFGSRSATAARARDPAPELRRPGVRRAAAPTRHRARRRRHGGSMAVRRGRDVGLRLRAAARRQGAVRERLHAGVARRAGRRASTLARRTRAGRRVASSTPPTSPPARPRDVYVYFDNDAKVKAPRDASGSRVSSNADVGGEHAGPRRESWSACDRLNPARSAG